jgi:hypothetical protein
MQTTTRPLVSSNPSQPETFGAGKAAQPCSGDLQRLIDAIVDSDGENLLAIDILANLAAYPGAEGHEAQQVLRKLYDNPGSGQACVDEKIRAGLVRAAYTICELALLTAPEISGDALELPLSITVAALACRYPVPEGARDVSHLARAHIERQLGKSAACPFAKRVIDEQRPGST